MLSNNSSRKRQCRQLELRVPELPSYPEERVLPALQGEVADKKARPLQSLLGLNRFTHYITRTPLNLLVNSCEIFTDDPETNHQKTTNDEFQ